MNGVRCTIHPTSPGREPLQRAWFLGLLSTDHGDMAIVRYDFGGMYVFDVHASRVVFDQLELPLVNPITLLPEATSGS
jgi:hypothetical protein